MINRFVIKRNGFPISFINFFSNKTFSYQMTSSKSNPYNKSYESHSYIHLRETVTKIVTLLGIYSSKISLFKVRYLCCVEWLTHDFSYEWCGWVSFTASKHWAKAESIPKANKLTLSRVVRTWFCYTFVFDWYENLKVIFKVSIVRYCLLNPCKASLHK